MESMKEEFEAALENKSEATKTFVRAHIALLEEYVALMNANNRNPQVWLKLQKELSEKTEAMRAAYVKERADQGLPSEVGWMSSGKAS